MKGNHMQKSLDWLKQFRADCELSTYQAASLCDISQSYYYAIESGKRGVPVDTAKRIARAFGFDWQKFYAA
jgi:DNA-binding XRE family transcriptional regulator